MVLAKAPAAGTQRPPRGKAAAQSASRQQRVEQRRTLAGSPKSVGTQTSLSQMCIRDRACIETPALDFEILLPGAEGGVVLVDRGAGRPDQFEAHAVRIAPDSGALQDFTLVTSATTVTFVGYPCPLERYGWIPGPLDLRPGAKLPTGARCV